MVGTTQQDSNYSYGRVEREDSKTFEWMTPTKYKCLLKTKK